MKTRAPLSLLLSSLNLLFTTTTAKNRPSQRSSPQSPGRRCTRGAARTISSLPGPASRVPAPHLAAVPRLSCDGSFLLPCLASRVPAPLLTAVPRVPVPLPAAAPRLAGPPIRCGACGARLFSRCRASPRWPPSSLRCLLCPLISSLPRLASPAPLLAAVPNVPAPLCFCVYR